MALVVSVNGISFTEANASAWLPSAVKAFPMTIPMFVFSVLGAEAGCSCANRHKFNKQSSEAK
jgi:hypothetical protein